MKNAIGHDSYFDIAVMLPLAVGILFICLKAEYRYRRGLWREYKADREVRRADLKWRELNGLG